MNLHNNVFTSPNCAFDQDVPDAVASHHTRHRRQRAAPAGLAAAASGGTGGGNGGGGGGGNGTETSQISTVPTGSVDTGLAGPVNGGHSYGVLLTGVAGIVGFGALTMAARRRRRVM